MGGSVSARSSSRFWEREAGRAVATELLPPEKVNPMPLATCPAILYTVFSHLVPTCEGRELGTP